MYQTEHKCIYSESKNMFKTNVNIYVLRRSLARKNAYIRRTVLFTLSYLIGLCQNSYGMRVSPTTIHPVTHQFLLMLTAFDISPQFRGMSRWGNNVLNIQSRFLYLRSLRCDTCYSYTCLTVIGRPG